MCQPEREVQKTIFFGDTLMNTHTLQNPKIYSNIQIAKSEKIKGST